MKRFLNFLFGIFKATKLNTSNNNSFKNSFENWCEGDEFIGSYGEFGLETTNPIPVNHTSGMHYYILHLNERFKKNFSYNRLGSRRSENENIPFIIDIYEVFDENGFKYPTLYACMYSRINSSKIPVCFTVKDS